MDFDLLLLAGDETLAKYAAFVVVQALVYLILSKSSGVFSGAARSASFRRPERSESARHMAALLAEMMRPGGAPSTPAGIQRGGRWSNDGGDVDVELELMLIRCSFSS
ncbi:hypothetical protein E2562_006250 [Oryza meyeriana var. granulata]|uniref:Uncharacterized protein n=1 Tax=Oryza meyeriana var. granulata TaxID=110450 RepID=A0A6G1CNT7_9ORYZ|nr:hypothetical protein E2562_006250 [Oryza meyeriana var. granulata]